jgi:hypothetical protein
MLMVRLQGTTANLVGKGNLKERSQKTEDRCWMTDGGSQKNPLCVMA